MALVRNDIAQWLNSLGIEAFDGRAGFVFDGTIPIDVELSEDEQAVLLIAQVGTLAKTATAPELRRLMQSAHLGLATAGSALTLGDDGETLTIWRELDLNGMTRPRLDDIFTAFLAAAEHTAHDLHGLSGSTAPHTTSFSAFRV